MGAKIFVIGVPSMRTLMDDITNAIEDALCRHKEVPKKSCEKVKRCCEKVNTRYDLTPNRFKCCEFGPAPIPQWGIGGRPKDDNLRFGAGFEIDEPRRSDYLSRHKFLEDHKAFDRFVEAGEDCVARGLEKPSHARAIKCKAERRRLEDGPPMNLDLIGESDFWDEDDLNW